jgi:DNA-binding LytR/AlgR family response regulator
MAEIPVRQNDAYLIFHNRDEMTKVRLEKVAYFEADGNYTHVTFTNAFNVSVPVPLCAIETLINDKLRGRVQPFIRIGKKYIVNQRCICHINTLKQRLVLTDFESDKVFTLTLAKEALKNLKELYKNDSDTWK